MKVALAQKNYTVGNLDGNAALIAEAARQAQRAGADLVVTSELAISGYPPRDLLLRRSFIERCRQALEQLAHNLRSAPPVLVGIAEINDTPEGRPLFNTAALLSNGRVEARFRKCLLPTYDVFDEDRYFEPACGPQILHLDGWSLGITICEDIWNSRSFWAQRRYHADPIEELARNGIDALVNLSASPFTVGKQQVREAMLAAMAREHGIPVLYVNQVGGNDDLVFDGRSFCVTAEGKLIGRAASFQEDLLLVDLQSQQGQMNSDDLTGEVEIWKALVLGTRDYVRKCGFSRVILGLSGGIDSSVTAAVATEAVGAENVLGVLMPSPYSSRASVEDAEQLAEILGIRTLTLPIANIMQEFETTLRQAFTNRERDVTEENIQARIRGDLLMALSNKYGALLLTTGNKSELAVGYCTLYGDMCGGFAVISDVPKTMIYHLAEHVNQQKETIPLRVLSKAPSAELRPDQTDQDSLPPYEQLDEILERYIEGHQSAEEIIADGLDEAIVRSVLRMVHRGEFKRKQAAPGIKVSDLAFGTGWRMPIASKQEEQEEFMLQELQKEKQ